MPTTKSTSKSKTTTTNKKATTPKKKPATTTKVVAPRKKPVDTSRTLTPKKQVVIQNKLDTPEVTPINNDEAINARNAKAILVIGILSIILSSTLAGMVLGIVGFCLAKKNKNSNGMDAGYVCSLIGMILGIVFMVVKVILIVVFFNTIWPLVMEQINREMYMDDVKDFIKSVPDNTSNMKYIINSFRI